MGGGGEARAEDGEQATQARPAVAEAPTRAPQSADARHRQIGKPGGTRLSSKQVAVQWQRGGACGKRVAGTGCSTVSAHTRCGTSRASWRGNHQLAYLVVAQQTQELQCRRWSTAPASTEFKLHLPVCLCTCLTTLAWLQLHQ